MRSTPVSALGAATVLLLSLAGCGGSDTKSEADVKKELSELFQADGAGGLSADAADCYAQIIIDDVGLDKLRDVDLSADEPPADLQDDIIAAATRAAEECELTGSSG